MLQVEVIRNNLKTAETARISTTMKHQENIYSIYAYDMTYGVTVKMRKCLIVYVQILLIYKYI